MQRHLKIEQLAVSQLRPHPDNPRLHSRQQLSKIARSIKRYGFTNPILVDQDGIVIAGHGRLEAASLAGLDHVPAIRITGLTPDERRALMLADNQIALESSWDPDRLARTLSALVEVDFDVEDAGFDVADVDLILCSNDETGADEADHVEEPDRRRPAVSRLGDCFILGEHRLLCGDALSDPSYVALLGSERAGMVFTDPPYNVPTRGHIQGRGRTRHPDFVQAAGEMSGAEYTEFLQTALTLMTRFSRTGAILDVCVDWRHVGELLAASRNLLTLKNLCVWDKGSGGQGSLYRSQHEFVAVFKSGDASHVNNVELGRHGRNRTNVWRYPGASTFRKGRLADLAAHPTVKPVRMVADAILDCSRIGDVILDSFAGSGTILLACQRTRRRAAAIELDPVYVDTAIRRFTQRTGIGALHEATGLTFEALAQQRSHPESAE